MKLYSPNFPTGLQRVCQTMSLLPHHPPRYLILHTRFSSAIYSILLHKTSSSSIWSQRLDAMDASRRADAGIASPLKHIHSPSPKGSGFRYHPAWKETPAQLNARNFQIRPVPCTSISAAFGEICLEVGDSLRTARLGLKLSRSLE